MRRHRILLATLFALGLAAASVTTAAASEPPFAVERPVYAALVDRTCATPEPTPFEMNAARASLRRSIEEGRAGATGLIQVAWHVIHDGTNGNIPQSQIEAQIAYMNASYAGTGFTFALASVDRTESRAWFRLVPGTGKERRAMQALAIDPAHRFNVYSCKPGQNLLGWSTFPWYYPEASFLHGVVIHYGSVPDGYLSPFNLGGTLAHEAGHYLGLYHTFQGGCVAPGDDCDDTPFEASPATGCPEGRDTCTQPGLDPIHNYMDYTYDACYTEFTAQQSARMQALTGTYRPSLLNAPVAQSALQPAGEGAATGGVAFRNVFPNPFKTSAAVQLYLPRSGQVSVRVYNVAGQLVETLADGEMAAGEHSLVFAPKLLAPGTYFIRAVAAGSKSARTVVLIR